MFIKACHDLFSRIAKIPFDTLVFAVWGSYAVIFITALIATLVSVRAKRAEKKPFLALTNAYSGVNLAVFLLKCPLNEALVITAIFWVAGYLWYGILCFCSIKGRAKKGLKSIASVPVQPVYTQPVTPVKGQAPAFKNNIKLDHAVTVTENLLSKNLSKSDRQELEKLKATLAVLQIKGSLTPAESDILNENFNALLKLMAKYNA